MLYVGSDDGVYRFSGGFDGDPDPNLASAMSPDHVLESGAVMRLRRLDAFDGLFAATKTGLFHTVDGDAWTDLGVPIESVYSVGASSDGETLYAGTRPARVFQTPISERTRSVQDGDGLDVTALEWRECEGFQALPSREHWRLPRHEGLAQVRDVKGLPGVPGSVVAAVEVGGVHASTDRGETWTERRGDVEADALQGVDRSDDWSQRPGDVHDDVHELAVIDAAEWVAATGFGLFRTADAGQSWTRLDDGVEQRYFRTVSAFDRTVYAAGALSSSGGWDDPDENPGFFAYRPGRGRSEITSPRPEEVVTGLVAVSDTPFGDTLFAGTHRGTLLRAATEQADAIATEWTVAGEFPVGPDTTGTYTPLAWLEV